MFKTVIRKKVLVVPYRMSRQDGKLKIEYVMVQDLKTREWGFISGGVKKHEHDVVAAQRELAEETSKIITLPDLKLCKVFKYTTTYRPEELKKMDIKRNEVVNSRYKIYMFRIDDFHNVKHDFIVNKEVIDIDMREFKDFKNVWKLSQDIYNNFFK